MLRTQAKKRIPSMKNGILIAIEGIDGSGKSTLARNLEEALFNQGHSVVRTQEPSHTSLGKQLRSILHNQETPLARKAEFLLFAADRAQHFQDVVLPALAKGKIVISDRMADSSLAYQGYGRHLSKDMIKMVNDWVMETRHPDYIIYLKLDPAHAARRIQSRGEPLSAFEQEKNDFQCRISHGFDEMYAMKNNVIVLDATKSEFDLQQDALRALKTLL